MMRRSDVAQLRRQIELELDAMQRGMTGMALGTAYHAFIRRRMDRIGVCQNHLAAHVGTETAHHIVGQMYVQAMERNIVFDAVSSDNVRGHP